MIHSVATSDPVSEATVARVPTDLELSYFGAPRDRSSSPISDLSNVELFRRLNSDRSDHAVKGELVERFQGLIRSSVTSILMGSRIWHLREDLIGQGQIGLLEALNCFEPERGVKFETYAVVRIRGSMIDWLRGEDSHGRIDRSREHFLTSVERQLSSELGRSASDDDIAQYLGLPVDSLNAMRAALSVSTVSLDFVLRDPERERQGGFEDVRSEAPQNRIEEREFLKAAVVGFSKVERLVVICDYFLNLTLKEIGEHLGISESRVSQISSRLVPRIRNNLIKYLDRPRNAGERADESAGSTPPSVPEDTVGRPVSALKFSWDT